MASPGGETIRHCRDSVGSRRRDHRTGRPGSLLAADPIRHFRGGLLTRPSDEMGEDQHVGGAEARCLATRSVRHSLHSRRASDTLPPSVITNNAAIAIRAPRMLPRERSDRSGCITSAVACQSAGASQADTPRRRRENRTLARLHVTTLSVDRHLQARPESSGALPGHDRSRCYLSAWNRAQRRIPVEWRAP